MSTEKAGRKPDDAGGVGIEDPSGNEVEGHKRRTLLYTCWNCGAQNYVDPDWKYFVCWRCGPSGINYIN
jgi:hypothetical protein